MLKDSKPRQTFTLQGSQLPPVEEAPRLLRQEPPAKPPTEEELAYLRALDINPNLSELTKRLALVGSEFSTKGAVKDVAKLQKVVAKALEGERMYTPEQVLQALQDSYQLPPERAQKGLEALVAAKLLVPLLGKTHYYLAGSSPF